LVWGKIGRNDGEWSQLVETKRKKNRLAKEQSPYLQQHATNPVDWYPWGEEAFAKAKAEDKPIFLSIGYSTCHWCHVMERESFSDPEVAAALNTAFIPVKVDREERPDLDRIYMTVCQALTGGGGWPLTVIMTPEQKPFFCRDLFPEKKQLRPDWTAGTHPEDPGTLAHPPGGTGGHGRPKHGGVGGRGGKGESK